MIIVTEAAKWYLTEIKSSGGSNGEILRLDRVGATANGDEPKLAVYAGVPARGAFGENRLPGRMTSPYSTEGNPCCTSRARSARPTTAASLTLWRRLRG